MSKRTWISSFAISFAMFFAAIAVIPATVSPMEEDRASESAEFEECKAVSLRGECRSSSVRRLAYYVTPLVDDRLIQGTELTSRVSCERDSHNGIGAHRRT